MKPEEEGRAKEPVRAFGEPAPEPDVDLDLEPREYLAGWDELLALWEHTRIAAGLNHEHVVPSTEKLFAAELRKHTAMQWAGCLEAYVDRSRSKGLEAAKNGFPLRMLVGKVREERMPPIEPETRRCCACGKVAEQSAPNGRALCSPCWARWAADLEAVDQAGSGFSANVSHFVGWLERQAHTAGRAAP